MARGDDVTTNLDVSRLLCALRMFRAAQLTAVALVCALVGHSNTGNAAGDFRWQVLEAETYAPIADVYVLARYEGGGGWLAHSTGGCYRVELMKTGADGYYQFPVDGDRAPHLTAYKAGYDGDPGPAIYIHQGEEVVNGRTELRYYTIPFDRNAPGRGSPQGYPTEAAALAAAGRNNVYFKRFTGTPRERVKRLWSYVTATTCVNAGDTRKNVVPFYEAIYAEMNALAVTPDEIAKVKELPTIIDGERNAR
jgi:hypothetical protein